MLSICTLMDTYAVLRFSLPFLFCFCHTCSFHFLFFMRLTVSPSVSDDLCGATKVSYTKGTSLLVELYDFLMGQQSLQSAAITAN